MVTACQAACPARAIHFGDLTRDNSDVLLFLTRRKWRASLNHFAEAMTLFAVTSAGLFPIFRLGRPCYVYWIVAYPNVQGLWPQWRSALIWDFWAVGNRSARHHVPICCKTAMEMIL